MAKGQDHPVQYHKIKEETFIVIHGELEIIIDDKVNRMKKGEQITVVPGSKHRFTAITDCIIEELSTMSLAEDSYYIDEEIQKKPRSFRKSYMPLYGLKGER